MKIELNVYDIDLIFRSLNAFAEKNEDYEEDAAILIEGISSQGGSELQDHYDKEARNAMMDQYNRCMESGSHMA